MQLTQIGKMLGLGLDAESDNTATQELALDSDGLSFTDALETTQVLPLQVESELLQDTSVFERDEVDSNDHLDSVLYLQQFLQLEDNRVAETGTDAPLPLKTMPNLNQRSVADANTLPSQSSTPIHHDAMPELSIATQDLPNEVEFAFDDAMLQTVSEQAELNNPVISAAGDDAAMDETYVQEMTDKAFIEQAEQQTLESSKVSDSDNYDDTERLEERLVSETAAISRPEEQGDVVMTKLAGVAEAPAGLKTAGSAGNSAVAQEYRLHTPVYQEDWGDEFNQRILWLGQQKIDKALLELHPKDLGPVQVQIHMQDNQTHLQIQVNDALVQQRIQDSLPELKALLEMQGLGLGQTNIESQHRGQQSNESQAARVDRDAPIEELDAKSHTDRVLGVTRDGRIDTYA